MTSSIFRSLFVAVAILGGAVSVMAQADTARPVIPSRGGDEERQPRTIRETLEKMRIEKEKKEYDKMLDRGSEVLKITEEIEKAFEESGQLTPTEYSKIASVEKLVKKIRDDLGGDDDEKKNEVSKPLNPAEAVKSLRQMTLNMFEELKKTTRFSISASAIQTTNAILRVARFLKVAR